MTSSPRPPLGLTQLLELDKVVIRQRTPVFNSSKFVVMSSEGLVVLHAREDEGVINKMLAGKDRAISVRVFDTQDREVMSLRRPYSVGESKMEVSVAGQLTSVLREELTFFKPVMNVCDATGKLTYRVKGPHSISGLCDFEVLNTEKRRVGLISKRWSGLSREIVDEDCYQLRFSSTLVPEQKALVIAVCFFIDFLHFDN